MADPPENPQADLVGLLDAVVRLSPVPMLIADADGRLLAANARWFRLSCSDTVAPAGPGAWPDGLDPPARRRLHEEMNRQAAGGAPATLELQMHVPTGVRWTRWWIHRRQIDRQPLLVLVVVDVHEDVIQRDDLRQLATRDDLTGLVNRRFFLEAVEQALRRAERFPEPACLLYVDLDHFKAVNDQAGHAVGDRVLSAVASRLRTAVRGADVVGRIGGDEFAVLIERLSSPGEAAIVARRVQEALSGSVEVEGERWPIAASVGIALTDGGGGESAVELLARADQAMYSAKRTRAGTPAQAEPVDLRQPAFAATATTPATTPATPPATAPAAATTAPAPAPAAAPPAPPSEEPPGHAPAAGRHNSQEGPTITAADLKLLRQGMDTIRDSLERLLEGLQHDPL